MNRETFMEREGIYQIRRYLVGRYSVTLHDGRIGVGQTVDEALENAKRPDAVRLEIAA